MLDEQDQGTRIGVGVALGVVLLLIIGLLGWLTLRGGSTRPAASIAATTPAATSSAMSAATVTPAVTASAAASPSDLFVDTPLAGDIAGTLFFAVGQAALPADAAASIEKIKATLSSAAPSKKLVVSGFHDASGDPAKNAELAKERAKSVRAALEAAGIDPTRVSLRKPESTTGDGNAQEARRVEVRLVE